MPMKDPTTGEEYEDWEDCVQSNQDKDTPDKYCGWVKQKSEESMSIDEIHTTLT